MAGVRVAAGTLEVVVFAKIGMVRARVVISTKEARCMMFKGAIEEKAQALK